MKLAVVGSRAYTNEARIRLVIEKYHKQYPYLAILSGGCPDGGDALGKKIALELCLPYYEFPPAHRHWNKYCVLPPPDEYGKPYHVRNYFERNTKIAEHCDDLIAFVVQNVACRGTMDTVNKAHRLGKRVFVFEDKVG